MVGVLSSLLYAGLVLAQYYGAGLLPPAPAPERCRRAALALFTVGLNVFGFMAVAALSGYLAEGLRRADAKLRRARRTRSRTCRRSASTSSTA